MPCPTCDGTMQLLEVRWFWCPRCGTVKDQGTHHDDVTAPYLVAHARRYRVGSGLTREQQALWQAVGLDEATLPPEQRPVLG